MKLLTFQALRVNQLRVPHMLLIAVVQAGTVGTVDAGLEIAVVVAALLVVATGVNHAGLVVKEKKETKNTLKKAEKGKKRMTNLLHLEKDPLVDAIVDASVEGAIDHDISIVPVVTLTVKMQPERSLKMMGTIMRTEKITGLHVELADQEMV